MGVVNSGSVAAHDSSISFMIGSPLLLSLFLKIQVVPAEHQRAKEQESHGFLERLLEEPQ
jgi:hypothetical protein